MAEETCIVHIGNEPIEVHLGDEVQVAADFPGVWLRVVKFGPPQSSDNTPAVFLRTPEGKEFWSVAGAIVAVRHSRK
jgi:hypothetical protein